MDACVHILKGEGGGAESRTPLFTKNDTCFYYLILNANKIFEQYSNDILVVVGICFL